jgi:hypothetical protein
VHQGAASVGFETKAKTIKNHNFSAEHEAKRKNKTFVSSYTFFAAGEREK